MENTKIEWADHTFNAWSGCTKVSEGCVNCYAEEMAKRFPALGGWGPGAPRKRTSEAYWRQPLRWNAACEKQGVRARVFVNSLSDWLDPEVPLEWLGDLMMLIRQCRALDWLLLTKRPHNWENRFSQLATLRDIGSEQFQWEVKWVCHEVPPANVWVGTTVENQKQVNERIPKLLQIPARVRFLSAEPLLGELDLRKWLVQDHPPQPNLHWVIVGGESGRNARPMHPDWARGLRDQCQAAGVPFFFKQWGEFAYGFRYGRRQLDGTPLDGKHHQEVPA